MLPDDGPAPGTFSRAGNGPFERSAGSASIPSTVLPCGLVTETLYTFSSAHESDSTLSIFTSTGTSRSYFALASAQNSSKSAGRSAPATGSCATGTFSTTSHFDVRCTLSPSITKPSIGQSGSDLSSTRRSADSTNMSSSRMPPIRVGGTSVFTTDAASV